MALDSMKIEITDHSDLALKEVQARLSAALEMVGNQAEYYAKMYIGDSMRANIDLTRYGEKDNSRVDTGAMRNSVTHAISGGAAYIGSNLPYAVYHELGTGIYASQPGGRQTPWVYTDRHGQTHRTRGLYPIHFLKNAASMHVDEYRRIMEDILGGGTGGNPPTS